MHGPIAYDVNRELSDYVDSLLPIVRVGAAIPTLAIPIPEFPNVTVGMEPWRPDPDSPSANDPIEFWLTSNAKYPLLSPFALDIIATPASEAYAERVFSVAGELTVGKRNRTAKNLERRVFLKVNKNN
jgi:hypothetical protein